MRQPNPIIGNSPPMREIRKLIETIADSTATVLINGESGTGKELVAQALHFQSPRAEANFVPLNCAAIPKELMESELFGHRKGAFTGALADRVGRFELAHGGTLFLDEIGDMPLSTQAKLLRVLQNQEVQRVGSLSARKVDVRVVAATNHDLRAAVRDKQFREDLYYRLSMVEIRIPKLTERKEDLPLLERHFISKFAQQYGKRIHGLTHRARLAISMHPWPGNVRELENVIGYAAMMTTSDMIDIQDLPAYMQKGEIAPPVPAKEESSVAPLGTLEEQERMLVTRALEAARGNQSEAARMLHIGRDALRYKMKKYGLV